MRALTNIQTVSLSKAKLADLLRVRPELAAHLSALVNRHKKAIKARATTLEHADFKGTFDTFPFADVMQMLMSTRKTGVLGLRRDADGGAIYLENGEAVHAWTDTLKGEAAFLERLDQRLLHEFQGFLVSHVPLLAFAHARSAAA